MKKLCIFLVCFAFAACIQNQTESSTPIFEGTTEITLNSPAADATLSGNFQYSVPADVKYVVFGLFTTQVTTSGKTITNPSAFKGGSRDGFSDFSRGVQSSTTLHTYDSTTLDFTATLVSPATCTNCYWAIWGYDQYGNLTHSSRQRKVNVP